MQSAGSQTISALPTAAHRAVSARAQPDTSPDPIPDPAPDQISPLPGSPLVVILGPTACGKTALSIPLAQAVNGEIVCADSRQIYRGMDIGTAKPTPAERAAVPHHLLDVVTPDQTYTLAEYQRAAYDTINTIHAQGKLPLLVGGTGQYITAVVEGWGIPEVPPNPDLRAELEAFAELYGARALHDRLHTHDPAAADRIDYRNVRRVIRALEVYLETGTPISVLQRKQPPPYRILLLGLTLPREVLYQRADDRIDRMLADGLLDEVRALLEAGYTWTCPAMSGLGYAQWQLYLDGATSYDEAVAAIRRETRAYIRRQDTWFKGHDTGTYWLDQAQIIPAAVVRLVHHWLANEGA
ncbi:MAG: tRNA (adenosine(37)-N6)-dimethylallyltransferase MiaA [Anaerolineae bacterium]|jgi:tRNA dimethylallyltransferase|nr:tRNA (adenosine(37)-N6)-dimethylallyltransferase MiaA [Anaerolineae bacterium]